MSTTATKSRPILFSGPMVRAILDGRKTQTRRVVKPQPPDGHLICPTHDGGWFVVRIRAASHFPVAPSDVVCPYGQPGDELWVREEHYRYGHWEPIPGVKTKSGRQKWQFVGDSDEVRFECPPDLPRSMGAPYQSRPGWYKRLARFMPRWASRITLTVKAVRVERLQEITEGDAVKEGMPGDLPDFHLGIARKKWFVDLWESINGPDSWDANPWVWVVEFERKAAG